MGLAELVSGLKGSPWQDFVGNALTDLGYGLTVGPDFGQALGAATQRTAQMAPDRLQEQEKKKADALALQQSNATKNWLQQKFPDLAQMVDAGMPVSEAWQEAMHRMQPQAAPSPIEINGQLVDPTTYKVLGDFRTQEAPKPPDAPSGYRFGEDGNLTYIPGGPADPSTPGKTTEATRRNQQLAKVIVPEMQSLEQNWTALSDLGSQAAGATGATMFASPEYQQAQNSLRTIIASYLYSVSGATANPGEVENQASILTPKIGESPQSVAAKLDRVKTMVQAVVEAAQGGSSAPAMQGDDIDALVKKYTQGQ